MRSHSNTKIKELYFRDDHIVTPTHAHKTTPSWAVLSRSARETSEPSSKMRMMATFVALETKGLPFSPKATRKERKTSVLSTGV